MIAHAKPVHCHSIDGERQFVSILPTIQSAAKYAFRRLPAGAREEAVQEVLASAYVAYCRLAEQGRADQAFGSTLGGYAVAQYRSGRRLGSPMNSADVMAPGQRRFRVERLNDIEGNDDNWRAAVIEDRKTPVPDQAAFRCDFPLWLAGLPKRDRRIAKALAASHTTSDVAERFGVSRARVSQLRRELQDAWDRFHGEPPR